MDNDIWILNPDYKLKNDIDRICMYSSINIKHDSSVDWISYIHPFQAIILTSFDGVSTLVEIYHKISTHFNISIDAVRKLISPYLGNKEPIYTSFGGEKIYFPKRTLIPKDEVFGLFPDMNINELCISMDKISLTNDRAHRAPHSILWMLTNKCVTDCSYCYADKATSYTPLSTSRCFEIIDEAKNLGVRNIDVIGGEIFLRKDWDLLIERMVRFGMSPSFISTKMPISDEIIKKILFTGYSNVIQISLDSLDEKILNDTIRAGQGYIHNLIKGIHLLEDHGFKLQIDTILTKKTATIDNLESLAAFISKIKNLVYWEIRVPQYSLYSTRRFIEQKTCLSNIEDIQTYVDNSLRQSFRGKILFSDDAARDRLRCSGPDEPCFKGGACGMLNNSIFILPDGKVSVCEQLYWHPEFIIGDLMRQNIAQVWQSQEAKRLFSLSRDLFRESSGCHHCNFFENCMSKRRRCVMRVMKAYGIDNWDYPDPRCKFAPEISNTEFEYK